MILKITMPDEDKIEVFTSFNKAVKFCEQQFGYGVNYDIEKWKEIKKNKNLEVLSEYLWRDGLWVELQNE